ncbi:MAG: hypothetical protein KatS3mg126_0281 [Lysobacteraceae bacterium]|nr:MAG: hypothetical protein KatS3mg126_0281 [Xanthomonadaceae bacterium]
MKNGTQFAVRMRNVSVSFPTARRGAEIRFQALNGVSLCLNHGDRLGVIGRNGAGKSTLLKLIADIMAPDAGVIERNHGACQLLSLNLGFLPHLTGRENAIMSGLLQGLSRSAIARKLDDIRDFAELGDFFEQPFKTYSSGMQARLGFSLAMQFEPDLLLIDEILGVGDVEFQKKSREALADKIHSGITVVMVSHSEDVVRSICNRAVWVEHGRTILEGNVDAVCAAYAGARGEKAVPNTGG